MRSWKTLQKKRKENLQTKIEILKYNLQGAQVALEVHRITLSYKEPKKNGPTNKCNDYKVSNTISLQMFKKMTLEFLTY